MSNLKQPAGEFNSQIRSHWGVENLLHRTLDISFGESKSRKRAGSAAQNYSMINRIVLNVLKKNYPVEVGKANGSKPDGIMPASPDYCFY